MIKKSILLILAVILLLGLNALFQKADAQTWLGSNHIPSGVNWTAFPIPSTGLNWTDVRVFATKYGDHSGLNWQAFGV